MAEGDTTWRVGLRNQEKNYLTAESFAFKVNCSSQQMKKKQTFSLEKADNDPMSNNVFIKTHLNRYLTAYSDGKIDAASDTRGEDQIFVIEVQKDGRWALKTKYNFYLGGAGEKIDAFTKAIGPDRLWTVVLAMHPQVCIRHNVRKRYVHLAGEELTTDEDVPWGADALITLTPCEDGLNIKYAFETSDARYLKADGSLQGGSGAIPAEARFTLEFFGGFLAFKGNNDRYLACTGANGAIKASKPAPPGKDEMWILEDSQPQFTFRSSNGKYLSASAEFISSGALSPNSDLEFFQMEINKETKKWSFRTAQNMLWSCCPDGSIKRVAAKGAKDDSMWFEVKWLSNRVQLIASNGKYVLTKGNGSLFASDNGSSNDSFYVFELINRPQLVLRGDFGFIAIDSKGALKSNSGVPEIFGLKMKEGKPEISGKNGKFWDFQGDGKVSVGGSQPASDIYFEFVEHSKMLIRRGDFYLQGFQNGDVKMTKSQIDASTLWEY